MAMTDQEFANWQEGVRQQTLEADLRYRETQMALTDQEFSNWEERVRQNTLEADLRYRETQLDADSRIARTAHNKGITLTEALARAKEQAVKEQDAANAIILEQKMVRERQIRSQREAESLKAHEALMEMALRFGKKLVEAADLWHESRQESAVPTVHTRAYYAEMLLEAAGRVTSLSRQVETGLNSGQDITQKMQTLEDAAADTALLLALLIGRERALISEKVLHRLTKNKGVYP
jgi:hypothetical protein